MNHFLNWAPSNGGVCFFSVGRSVGDNFLTHVTRLYAGYADAARRLRRNQRSNAYLMCERQDLSLSFGTQENEKKFKEEFRSQDWCLRTMRN